MEEKDHSIWPWLLGFVAYRSYKNRKNNKEIIYTFIEDDEDYYEDDEDIYDDY